MNLYTELSTLSTGMNMFSCGTGGRNRQTKVLYRNHKNALKSRFFEKKLYKINV